MNMDLLMMLMAYTASISAFLRAGYAEHHRAVEHGTESLEFRSQT